MNERIEEIRVEIRSHDPNAHWDPVLGSEVENLLSRTFKGESSEKSRDSVLNETRRILAKCISPKVSAGQVTGLVVGYVQSGKTLSFTALTALARDNGYQIVIIIAGTTNNLADQSRDRLLKDLGIEETSFPKWRHFHNPDIHDVARIRDVLAEWKDKNVPFDEYRTVLITVLKNHTRLRQLINTIRGLQSSANVPTLIIDDEADQASLNNLVRNGELSTTYSRLNELKNVLPHHSLIQYTATPQGNLLINLIDVLSASFAEVLMPGPDYVGGAVFFAEHSPYVRVIPINEIPPVGDLPDEPPESLLEALRLYFIGAASGYLRRDSKPPRRSMMVHPARETAGHKVYFQWVQSVRQLWAAILSVQDSVDEDRVELEESFRKSHAELLKTTPDLEPFQQLRILDAIRRTLVKQVNSLAEVRSIRWTDNYSWILVGGQMLDRGFTVEGLTTTYMPRGPGMGYADTIQQRARFFGYKRDYLGFCRVFLESDVADAYRAYIDHEEHLRKRLQEHNKTGKPLSEFRRIFLLDPDLRPTRSSIYEDDYIRPDLEQGYFYPRAIEESTQTRNHNQKIIESFLSATNNFVPDKGHQDRTPYQLHKIATELSLHQVYESLLLPLQVQDFEDNRHWIAMLELISLYLSDERREGRSPTCAVYQMRPGVETSRATTEGKIDQLFQGAYPDNQGAIYGGDRSLHPDNVTIQIHFVDLYDGLVSNSKLLAKSAPVVAIWLSSQLRKHLIVQQ